MMLKVIAGPASSRLAYQIASIEGFILGKANHRVFEDGELCPALIDIEPGETVVVVQSTQPPAENWLTLYLMLRAAKQAGAGKLIALVPYMGYSRQDRLYQKGEPHSSRLMAELIQTAGADVCITCQAHDKNIDSLFDIPFYNLETLSLFTPYLAKRVFFDLVFLAPDKGSKPLTQAYANYFKVPMISLTKIRSRSGGRVISKMEVDYDVRGKNLVLVDDIVVTGATLLQASKLLYKRGAHCIRIVCTHTLFASSLYKDLSKTHGIEEIITTDTIQHDVLSDPFVVLPIASLLSDFLKKLREKNLI